MRLQQQAGLRAVFCNKCSRVFHDFPLSTALLEKVDSSDTMAAAPMRPCLRRINMSDEQSKGFANNLLQIYNRFFPGLTSNLLPFMMLTALYGCPEKCGQWSFQRHRCKSRQSFYPAIKQNDSEWSNLQTCWNMLKPNFVRHCSASCREIIYRPCCLQYKHVPGCGMFWSSLHCFILFLFPHISFSSILSPLPCLWRV